MPNSIVERVKVIIVNNQKEVKIPTGLRLVIRRSCSAVLQLERFPGPAMVSVAFVDKETIQRLNKEYRNKDSATDVLSFPTSSAVQGEDGSVSYPVDPKTGFYILGDIAICIDAALEQSKSDSTNSLQKEVSFLTVHSMLHLLGYDHKEEADKNRMKERETAIMARLGYVSVPGHKSGI